MSNEGTLEITLLDVTAAPAADPDTRVSIRRVAANETIRVFRRSFPPTQRFKLPAFPIEKQLVAFIEPKRFRACPTSLFMLTDGKTSVRNVSVLRQPDQWNAKFTKWASLPDEFKRLKDVLAASPNLNVRGGETFVSFTDAAYDGVTGVKTVLAKTAMLNMFTKLTQLVEPVHNRKPWFGFVERFLQIGRERLIAVVDEEMADRIQTIRERIGEFDEYVRASPELHHKNFPARYAVPKTKMFSIKTREDIGNMQLTLGPGTDPDRGQPVWLLDTDIDENGKLLKHLGDLLKHKVTGGTHPHDIHEYLRLRFPKLDLGYVLA